MSARIKTALDGFYEYLQRPLFLWSRPILALLVLPIVLAVFAPLWRFDFEAPQYPHGLSFQVYSYKLEAGNEGNDLKEINILNHYIGMKKLEPVELDELGWMPFGFGIAAILLLRAAAIGNVRSLVDISILFLYFGAFSAGRFVYRLWTYGHHLAPDAPVRVKPFTPVILGMKQIGNFTTYGRPLAGTWYFAIAVFGVLALTIAHLLVGRARARRANAGGDADVTTPPP